MIAPVEGKQVPADPRPQPSAHESSGPACECALEGSIALPCASTTRLIRVNARTTSICLHINAFAGEAAHRHGSPATSTHSARSASA